MSCFLPETTLTMSSPAYIIGALFLGPASEVVGRRLVLSVSNWTFVIFNICCAVAPNIRALIAFRLLGGIGAVGCLTLSGGLCADLFVTEERGAAVAVSGIGVIFGPSIGPLLGGYIAQRAGWHWIFWVLTIASAITAGISEATGRESYAPVLIRRKTAALKRELGRPELRSCYESDSAGTVRLSQTVKVMLRPLAMCSSPVIVAFCTYTALTYGLLYTFIVSVTTVFIDTYHWNTEKSGLAYLGLGCGFLLGLLLVGSTSDQVIQKLKARNDGVYEPEMRLPYMSLFGLCLPCSLFHYGWSAQHVFHWIVPITGLALFGFGMIGIMFMAQMYMVDVFPLYASSAMAMLTVARSVVGALLPLAAPSLYSSLGIGWASSLLGFIALAMCPVPWLFWKKGEFLRKKFPLQIK